MIDDATTADELTRFFLDHASHEGNVVSDEPYASDRPLTVRCQGCGTAMAYTLPTQGAPDPAAGAGTDAAGPKTAPGVGVDSMASRPVPAPEVRRQAEAGPAVGPADRRRWPRPSAPAPGGSPSARDSLGRRLAVLLLAGALLVAAAIWFLDDGIDDPVIAPDPPGAPSGAPGAEGADPAPPAEGADAPGGEAPDAADPATGELPPSEISATRFFVAYPEGWRRSNRDDGLTLQPASGTVAVRIYLDKRPDLTLDDMAARARPLLTEGRPEAEVSEPSKRRDGKALGLRATFDGGTESALVLERGDWRYLVLRRESADASKTRTNEARAVEASFRPR
ncbi:MAG: hypothetical protein ACR2NA_09725 [Solirubrobacterales bacterium]